jgi:hypothetical protein
VPEDDGVHIDRNGILSESLLGIERRGLDSLINHRNDAVDDRNNREKAWTLNSLQLPSS